MASASGSVCASTGASPAAAVTPVGTGQSAPRAQPQRPVAQHLVAKETTTVPGGGGVTGDGVAAAAGVVILDEETGDDGTCSAEVEPAAKRQKRNTSKVWDYFTKSTVTEKNDDGQAEKQTWAKCKKCTFKTCGESIKGTTVLWNHLKSKHFIAKGQQLQVLKGEGNDADVKIFKDDPEVSLNKFYMAMIIMHEYPFKMVEHELIDISC